MRMHQEVEQVETTIKGFSPNIDATTQQYAHAQVFTAYAKHSQIRFSAVFKT